MKFLKKNLTVLSAVAVCVGLIAANNSIPSVKAALTF